MPGTDVAVAPAAGSDREAVSGEGAFLSRVCGHGEDWIGRDGMRQQAARTGKRSREHQREEV
jgi:hypothetical protein